MHAGIGVCPTWRSEPMERLTEAVSFSTDTETEASPNDRRPARALGGFHCSRYERLRLHVDPLLPFLQWRRGCYTLNCQLLLDHHSFTSSRLAFLLSYNHVGGATSLTSSLPPTLPGRSPGARQRSTVFLCFSRA